eukprot:NODE_2933_length_2119_cov_9.851908.p1 GENE.NODE_2933_length_2119_cov_9.851908~~NODE_2933_length_2119_cov_9.851908.p1  ORF type:complete len:348 (-),score=113.28 NODE_2933_length_2119_cov_9.851908:167-1210(-)
MRRDAGANFFKFDGVAGDPAEVSAEMEAMLALISELRDADDETIWINLTTGTWPSPFFLLWADSIWRGHRDVVLLDSPQLDGITARQRWQVSRECVVEALVFQRARLFPLARLMIHGAIFAEHGEARAAELHKATELDWEQEVWSHAAMGLQLQELYISAELMTQSRWDKLAEALRWAREHAEIFEDTHWALQGGPQGCRGGTFEPHGWAAWRHERRLGFVTLRNPRAMAAKTVPLAFGDLLELNAELRRGPPLRVEVVRRLAAKTSSKLGKRPCSYLGRRGDATQLEDGACAVDANAKMNVALDGAELLVLKVTQPSLQVVQAPPPAPPPPPSSMAGVELGTHDEL